MDDTTKVHAMPLISEENWLFYFQFLHSNEPYNSSQQIINNELSILEDNKKHSRP